MVSIEPRRFVHGRLLVLSWVLHSLHYLHRQCIDTIQTTVSGYSYYWYWSYSCGFLHGWVVCNVRMLSWSLMGSYSSERCWNHKLIVFLGFSMHWSFPLPLPKNKVYRETSGSWMQRKHSLPRWRNDLHTPLPQSHKGRDTRHETRCPARLVAPTVYGKTDSLIKATNPGREHASSPAAAVLLALHSVHRSVASIVDTLLSPPHQYFSTST